MGRGWGVRGADSNGTLLTKNCTTFETMVLNFSSLFQKGGVFFWFFFYVASDELCLFGALFKGLKTVH